MRESPKTFEGRYFLCLDVKEANKNNIVSRFHRITPQKTSTKLKKKKIFALQFYDGIQTRKQTDKSYIKNKKRNVAFSHLVT